MISFETTLSELTDFKSKALLHVETLGQFKTKRAEESISNKTWGRDKTIQLFEFLIANRHRKSLHKEVIMDMLWEDADDRDFKVAMHGINKALEPNRPARTEPTFIIRQGLSYQLDLSKIWVDVEAFEKLITVGNQATNEHPEIAIKAYQQAIELYNGPFLPNRIYEDWPAEERERTQVLILNTYISLAELLLNVNPTETIRLTQKAIAIDPCWEDAYRIQMQAYQAKGNRPQALKTYKTCVEILDEEYGISPLPATKSLLEEIKNA